MELVKIFDTKEEAEQYAEKLEQQMGIGLFRLKRDCDSYLHNARYRTRLMLKTTTADFANKGVLKAWERDENKNFFEYSWKNPSDSRSKKISLVRKQGNPYSYSEISFLWKNQRQMIDGKMQSDVWNQRCSIFRGKRLEEEWIDNRFLGKENEFESTD